MIADADLAAPGRAIFARDGSVTGTIGLRAAPALPAAELATSQAELAQRGVLAPLAERADEAIIRAAASTDAELFVVPGELASEFAPKDGVAPRCATR